MKCYTYNLIALIIVLTFLSCSKPIEVVLPQAAPQITVFSSTNVNEAFNVSILQSFSAYANITDTSFLEKIIPKNLRVTINDGVQTDTLLNDNLQYYTSTKVKMKVGIDYFLKIEDTITHKIATAQAIGMDKPNDAVTIKVNRNNTDTSIQMNVQINDEPNVENYYAMRLNVGASVSDEDIFPTNEKIFIINDEQIQNNTISKEFVVNRFNYNIQSFNDSLSVQVMHISKDYYLFLDAYIKNQDIINNVVLLNSAFTSNVVNGNGIFAASSYNKYFFDLRLQ